MSDKVDYRALYRTAPNPPSNQPPRQPPRGPQLPARPPEPTEQQAQRTAPLSEKALFPAAAKNEGIGNGWGSSEPGREAGPAPSPPSGPARPHNGSSFGQINGADSSWSGDTEVAPSRAVDFGVARRPHATGGARGRVNRMLGTRLPPTAAEEAFEAERRSIQAPVPTIKYVGVLHAKGGVGSSSVLQMMGNTLTDQRREPVYAIDADYGGSLLRRTLDASGTNSPKSTRTLHRWNPASGEHFGSMFTRTPQGLMVIGNPNDTDDERMTPEEFVEVLNKFPKEGPLRLIDMPHRDSTLFEPLLAGLHSIVLVTTPERDSVELSQSLINAIRGPMRRPDLVASMVVVVNHRSPADPLIDEKRLEPLFERGDDRGAAAGLKRVLYTRYDEHLAEGGPVDYTLVDKDTRKRYVTIAAATVARLTV